MSVIVTRLTGGLGNQMFQFAAGYALSLRRGVPLELDISSYGRDELRVYELAPFDLPATWIAVGMKADLVLFDPVTVIDQSTFENPRLRARGIHSVFVNGVLVWSGDQPAGNFPGRVLAPR